MHPNASALVGLGNKQFQASLLGRVGIPVLCDRTRPLRDTSKVQAVSRTCPLVCTSGTNPLATALSASGEPQRTKIPPFSRNWAGRDDVTR
jgi:hypothetical protein